MHTAVLAFSGKGAMSQQHLNGRAHGSVAQTGANDWSNGRDTGSYQAVAEMARSGHAPGPRQQQLSAAMRQIDALLKQNLALRQNNGLLMKALAKASRFAYRDELTGLASRRLLQDRFDQAVAHAARQHTQVVLLFLDLDKFKGINDAIGHLGADRVLQQAAGRLTSCIRRSDTACRFGGDEFVLLLTDIAGSAQAVAATNKIIAQLAIPYVIDGVPIRVTASVGTATYPVDGERYDELLQAADLTMYRNKARGTTAESALPI
jgi:diguanylate cyclase (GGDEF)-like protein